MRKQSVFYRRALPVCLGAVVLVTIVAHVAVGQYGFGRWQRNPGGYGYNPVRDFESYSFGAGDLPGPQPASGGGVLGSSIYSGGAPRSGNLGTPSGTYQSHMGPSNTKLMEAGAQRTKRVYDPMQPVTFATSASGETAMAAYLANQPTHQVVKATSDLATSADEPVTITRPLLTSLAPSEAGPYRQAMLKGESQLKDKKYSDALKTFETAKSESPVNAAEPALAMFLAALGESDGDYTSAADCLGHTLEIFPHLPLARVDIASFFADGEFDAIQSKLDEHIQADETDAHAMFVMGYLQISQNKVDAAWMLLDAAHEAAGDEELSDWINLLGKGLDDRSQTLDANAPDLQPAQAYPWAGISLSLPEGFVHDRLTHINSVFIASGGTPENPKRATLSIYPLPRNMELEPLMDAISKDIEKRAGVLDFETVADATVPFFDHSAIVRTMKLEYAGNTFVAARICFVRQVKTPEGDTQYIAYSLGTGALESEADQVLPTLAAMARSIELTDFSRPIDLPIPADGVLVSDPQLGFAIEQPNGWVGSFDEDGFSMGQFDFLDNGVVSPRVDVATATFPAGMTPEKVGKSAVEARAAEGFTVKVISHGECQLAGKTGYEVLIQKTREATADQDAQSWVEMGRIITVSIDDDEDEERMIALVILATDTDVEKTKAVMDAMAPKLSLIPMDASRTPDTPAE